eukprot:1080412-Rhodomonas_salina.2
MPSSIPEGQEASERHKLEAGSVVLISDSPSSKIETHLCNPSRSPLSPHNAANSSSESPRRVFKEVTNQSEKERGRQHQIEQTPKSEGACHDVERAREW